MKTHCKLFQVKEPDLRYRLIKLHLVSEPDYPHSSVSVFLNLLREAVVWQICPFSIGCIYRDVIYSTHVHLIIHQMSKDQYNNYTVMKMYCYFILVLLLYAKNIPYQMSLSPKSLIRTMCQCMFVYWEPNLIFDKWTMTTTCWTHDTPMLCVCVVYLKQHHSRVTEMV